MAVRDQGNEVLKKSGEEVVPGEKGDHYVKVGGLPSSSSGTIPPVPVAEKGTNTTPTIFNETIAAADIEQSLVLPINTKEFFLRIRSGSGLQLAFIANDSGTKFVTIKKNAVLEVRQFFSALTLYFQSSTAGDIIEVVAFS